MANLVKLITTALRVLIDSPLLWFFGLFLSAGFNFNWLYLSRGGFTERAVLWLTQEWATRQSYEPKLFLLTLILFALLGFIWVVANLVKISFVINLADLLLTDRLGGTEEYISFWTKQEKIFKQGIKFIIPVLAMSLFTMVAQAITTAILLSPWLWQKYIAPMPAMILLASLLFVIFILFFSLLNYFTVLFVVLYQKNFQTAFSAAGNLIKTSIKPLFMTCFVLFTIYIAGIWIGLQAISIIKPLFLIWLAFLNAYFNVGLFIFFKNNIKPIKFEEAAKAKPSLILKVSVDKTL